MSDGTLAQAGASVPTAGAPAGAYEFGPYQLIPATRVLSRDRVPVVLTPKAFDTLLFLIEHRDRVVTKDELLRSVWTDVVVEEGNLTQQIFLLRKALDDSSEEQRYIATLPRIGYRFVADVRVSAEAPTNPVGQTRRRWPIAVAFGIIAVVALLVLAALLAPRFYRWRPAESTAGLPTFRKLTFSEGVALMPSLSPDGRSFVYVGTSNLHRVAMQIYLRAVGGMTSICLTCEIKEITDERSKFTPAFSPDGERIAFAMGQDGGIFVMGRDGSSPRRITARGFNPTWSPDGTRIAYSTRHTDYIPIEMPTRTTSELWIVNVESGQTQQMNVEDGREPDWSPDGQRIAFWGFSADRRSRDVFTVKVDGGEPTRVTDHQADDWNPTWADGGRALYFVSNRAGTRGLWRVAMDQNSGRARADAEIVNTGSFVAYPVAGPGGTVIYSDVSATANVSLLAFDPRTGTAAGPSRPVTTGTDFWVCCPTPRGDVLALHRAAIAGYEDIFVVRRDGSGLRQLTNDPSLDRDPEISPDGRRVAFASDRGGTWGMWLIDVDGSNLRPLSARNPVSEWHRPLWSPQGNLIAAYEEPGHRTVLFGVDGTASTPIRVLPPPPAGEASSRSHTQDNRAWSPDGRQLALRTDEILATYSLETGEYKTARIPGIILGWLPDSSRLLLTLPWKRTLAVVDTKDWTLTEKPFPPEIPEADARLSLSSDGTALAITHTSYRADIWLMSTGSPIVNSPRP